MRGVGTSLARVRAASPDLAPLARQLPPITCPGTWPPAPPTRTCTRRTSSAATPTRRRWRTARQSSTTTSPRSRCTTTRPAPWPSAPTCCAACRPASPRWRSTTVPALEVGGPGRPGRAWGAGRPCSWSAQARRGVLRTRACVCGFPDVCSVWSSQGPGCWPRCVCCRHEVAPDGRVHPGCTHGSQACCVCSWCVQSLELTQ